MVRILRRCFQLLSLRDISGTTGTHSTHSLLPQRRRGTLGRGPERPGDVADLGPLQSDGEGAIFLVMEMAGGWKTWSLLPRKTMKNVEFTWVYEKWSFISHYYIYIYAIMGYIMDIYIYIVGYII